MTSAKKSAAIEINKIMADVSGPRRFWNSVCSNTDKICLWVLAILLGLVILTAIIAIAIASSIRAKSAGDVDNTQSGKLESEKIGKLSVYPRLDSSVSYKSNIIYCASNSNNWSRQLRSILTAYSQNNKRNATTNCNNTATPCPYNVEEGLDVKIIGRSSFQSQNFNPIYFMMIESDTWAPLESEETVTIKCTPIEPKNANLEMKTSGIMHSKYYPKSKYETGNSSSKYLSPLFAMLFQPMVPRDTIVKIECALQSGNSDKLENNGKVEIQLYVSNNYTDCSGSEHDHDPQTAEVPPNSNTSNGTNGALNGANGTSDSLGTPSNGTLASNATDLPSVKVQLSVYPKIGDEEKIVVCDGNKQKIAASIDSLFSEYTTQDQTIFQNCKSQNHTIANIPPCWFDLNATVPNACRKSSSYGYQDLSMIPPCLFIRLENDEDFVPESTSSSKTFQLSCVDESGMPPELYPTSGMPIAYYPKSKFTRRSTLPYLNPVFVVKPMNPLTMGMETVITCKIVDSQFQPILSKNITIKMPYMASNCSL